MTNIESKFSTIYQKQIWKSGESLSGSGSDKHRTKRLISGLVEFIKYNKIDSVFDAACGDMNYQPDIMKQLKNVSFAGRDIVSFIIEQNQKKHKQFSFDVGDITVDRIPKCDLVIIRDVFVHLTDQMIIDALSNICLSNDLRFVAMTSFMNHENVDVGETTFKEQLDLWRPLNLMKPPFELPFPDDIIHENCDESAGDYNDKCLLIWSIDSLREWFGAYNINAIVNL